MIKTKPIYQIVTNNLDFNIFDKCLVISRAYCDSVIVTNETTKQNLKTAMEDTIIDWFNCKGRMDTYKGSLIIIDSQVPDGKFLFTNKDQLD